MNYMIAECCFGGHLQKIKTSDTVESKGFNEYYNPTRFLVHCIQLTRVFTAIAVSISNPKTRLSRIRYCDAVLNKTIASCLLRYGGHLSGLSGMKSRKKQFHYVVALPQFLPYFIETVHKLVSAIINNPCSDLQKRLSLLSIKDLVKSGVVGGSTTTELPKLLLSRQIHGSTNTHLLHQHSLPWVFRNMPDTLSPRKEYGYYSEHYDHDVDIYFTGHNSETIYDSDDDDC